MTQQKAKAPPISLDPRDSASYMAEMTLQMMKMAQALGHEVLVKMYEMAYYEAYAAAHPVKITPEELEELKALLPKIDRKKETDIKAGAGRAPLVRHGR